MVTSTKTVLRVWGQNRVCSLTQAGWLGCDCVNDITPGGSSRAPRQAVGSLAAVSGSWVGSQAWVVPGCMLAGIPGLGVSDRYNWPYCYGLWNPLLQDFSDKILFTLLLFISLFEKPTIGLFIMGSCLSSWFNDGYRGLYYGRRSWDCFHLRKIKSCILLFFNG